MTKIQPLFLMALFHFSFFTFKGIFSYYTKLILLKSFYIFTNTIKKRTIYKKKEFFNLKNKNGN